MVKFQEHEVLSNTYFTCNIGEPIILKTLNLKNQIAFTYFAPRVGKVGMARGVEPHKLDTILDTVFSKSNNTIDVTFIGGDDSKESEEIASQLVWHLNCKDGGSNIINITAFDVCTKPHPESFLFSCNSGLKYLVE